jgi:hypothetical protein
MLSSTLKPSTLVVTYEEEASDIGVVAAVSKDDCVEGREPVPGLGEEELEPAAVLVPDDSLLPQFTHSSLPGLGLLLILLDTLLVFKLSGLVHRLYAMLSSASSFMQFINLFVSISRAFFSSANAFLMSASIWVVWIPSVLITYDEPF